MSRIKSLNWNFGWVMSWIESHIFFCHGWAMSRIESFYKKSVLSQCLSRFSFWRKKSILNWLTKILAVYNPSCWVCTFAPQAISETKHRRRQNGWCWKELDRAHALFSTQSCGSSWSVKRTDDVESSIRNMNHACTNATVTFSSISPGDIADNQRCTEVDLSASSAWSSCVHMGLWLPTLRASLMLFWCHMRHPLSLQARAAIRTFNPREEKYTRPELKFKRAVFIRNVNRLKEMGAGFAEGAKFIKWDIVTNCKVVSQYVC